MAYEDTPQLTARYLLPKKTGSTPNTVEYLSLLVRFSNYFPQKSGSSEPLISSQAKEGERP